jgi:eukaryotic-like serine/threonine-protein kinase
VHRSVLATRRRVFGTEHPLVATSLVSLSDALIAQGRTAEALPLLRDAVALRERVLPAGHPDIAKAKTKLAAAEHPAPRSVARAVATPTP